MIENCAESNQVLGAFCIFAKKISLIIKKGLPQFLPTTKVVGFLAENIMKYRKKNPVLEQIVEKLDSNPIVETLPREESDVLNLTTKEHIRELQEILVQTVIDFSKKHGLKDIYSVVFGVDEIQASADEGEWCPASDSHIRVEGVIFERFKRKNGEVTKLPLKYTIGENI